MTKLDILDKILTEFDETISSEFNVDPLGLLVIWSSYGQDIFRRRISSISNDVRNFTLNLFNHAVIRSLIEDDGVVLGKGLRNDPVYGAGGKDCAAFKQASDSFAAAKVRELITFVDLHLELVVRDLYGQAFFGGTVSDGTKERVRKQLAKNIPAFKRLAKFAPFVAGDRFTMADCAAWASLPLVGQATKLVLGEDLLLAAGVDWKTYVKLVGERPTAAKVAADRKADAAALAKKP